MTHISQQGNGLKHLWSMYTNKSSIKTTTCAFIQHLLNLKSMLLVKELRTKRLDT
jgi:hypothetical protein